MPATVGSKKKSAPTSSRGPGRPCSSFTRPAPVTPPTRSQSQPADSGLAAPTTNINNNININIGSSSGTAVSRRQHCPYCGRHYRSLARHLEKHHANQPEVRTAMELAHLHTHGSSNGTASHPHPSSSSTSATQSHSFAVPQASASNSGPPSLFSRERESPGTRSSTGAVSFSLSLSPPSSSQPATNKKGPSLPLASPKRSTPPAATRVKTPSPPPPVTPRRGRRLKKEKQEEQPKVEVESSRCQEELVPPPTPEPDIDPNEDLELSGEGEADAPEEKNGDIVRCGRTMAGPDFLSLTLGLFIKTLFLLFFCSQLAQASHVSASLLALLSGPLPPPAAALVFPRFDPFSSLCRGLAPAVPLQPLPPHPLQPPPRM